MGNEVLKWLQQRCSPQPNDLLIIMMEGFIFGIWYMNMIIYSLVECNMYHNLCSCNSLLFVQWKMLCLPLYNLFPFDSNNLLTNLFMFGSK